MNRFLATSLALASSFAPLTSLAAAREFQKRDVNASWICNDTTLINDNSYTLELFEATSAGSQKIEIFHSGILGTRKVASLPLCTVENPPDGVADGSTTVTCHDGAWKGSLRAVLYLGGLLPTVGSATLFSGGLQDEVEIASFSCRQNRD